MNLVVLTPLRVEATALCGTLPRGTTRITGMGAQRAAAIAATVRDRGPVAIVGTCGALVEDLPAGTLVVATQVWRDGRVRPLPASAPLVALLRSRGLPVRPGRIAAASGIVRGPARRELATRSGAIAVDMESAAVADVIGDRPVVALRAVSDRPRQRFGSLHAVTGGIAALAALRRAAPALLQWAEELPHLHVSSPPGTARVRGSGTRPADRDGAADRFGGRRTGWRHQLLPTDDEKVCAT